LELSIATTAIPDKEKRVEFKHRNGNGLWFLWIWSN